APFFSADGIEIPPLEQQCEKALSEIFCVFRSDALASYETINWSPIRATKFFERRLRGCRRTLRRQYDAPVRRSKRRAAMSISVHRGQRSYLIICRGHISDPIENPCETQACITLKEGRLGQPSFLAMLYAQPTISCAQLLECERHRNDALFL